MYWWHIVSNQDENSLLSKVYKAQKNNASHKDWVLLIEKDKQDLGININDEDLKLNYKKKEKFKVLVKRKSEIKAFEYLNKLKATHSKMHNIKFDQIKCADYLMGKSTTQTEAKILFKFRTRMAPVKQNFKTQYHANLFCDLCKVSKCTQEHLFQCHVLRNTVSVLMSSSAFYKDSFQFLKASFSILKDSFPFFISPDRVRVQFGFGRLVPERFVSVSE